MSTEVPHSVYVCSLPRGMSFESPAVRRALRDEMERFGRVSDVRVSRSFAFVDFSRSSSARRAVGNRLTLCGETIGEFPCCCCC